MCRKSISSRFASTFIVLHNRLCKPQRKYSNKAKSIPSCRRESKQMSVLRRFMPISLTSFPTVEFRLKFVEATPHWHTRRNCEDRARAPTLYQRRMISARGRDKYRPHNPQCRQQSLECRSLVRTTTRASPADENNTSSTITRTGVLCVCERDVKRIVQCELLPQSQHRRQSSEVYSSPFDSQIDTIRKEKRSVYKIIEKQIN